MPIRKDLAAYAVLPVRGGARAKNIMHGYTKRT